MLELTRPFFPIWSLRRVLVPRAGERILEIGPGTGRHALAIARNLAPTSTLDVVDIQQPMLDAVCSRAAKRGVANIHATVGDARDLPWDDHTFDAAYLVTVLGEIPHRQLVLAQLHRTLKPGGRLVVGEMIMDPDNMTIKTLRAGAEAAGFDCDRVFGLPAFYLARFTRR